MRQLIIILTLIFSFSQNVNSQTDSVYTGTRNAEQKKTKARKNSDWKKKLTYGGNFQAQFGTVTFIYLSPTIGYTPFKNFNFGVGFIYNYMSADYGQYGKFSQSIYGGHSYARYFVTPNIFLQAQYDKLLQPDYYNINNRNSKVWVDYAMLGAGYSQPLGDNFSFYTSLMYNLTYQRLSIYPSPYVFQLGFTGRF
jgi:hypothetical protein